MAMLPRARCGIVCTPGAEKGNPALEKAQRDRRKQLTKQKSGGRSSLTRLAGMVQGSQAKAHLGSSRTLGAAALAESGDLPSGPARR